MDPAKPDLRILPRKEGEGGLNKPGWPIKITFCMCLDSEGGGGGGGRKATFGSRHFTKRCLWPRAGGGGSTKTRFPNTFPVFLSADHAKGRGSTCTRFPNRSFRRSKASPVQYGDQNLFYIRGGRKAMLGAGCGVKNTRFPSATRAEHSLVP